MIFEEAKQQLIAGFETCHLRVLVFIKATHQDNTTKTAEMRSKQVEKLRKNYGNDIPAEHLAHLICNWASDGELHLYAKLDEVEKLAILLTICIQCKKLKEIKAQRDTIQNLMYNCN